jgi:nucleotide-binding universal stress UspA family protein
MKKILIALDFDPSALKIAKAGYSLAKALKAQIILLHVTSEISYYSSLNYSPIVGFGIFSNENIIEKDAEIESKNLAQNFLDNCKEKLADETIQTVVENGDFAENILAVASEYHADMIVMGTQGRNGFKKMLLGNVAEKFYITVPYRYILFQFNKENYAWLN